MKTVFIPENINDCLALALRHFRLDRQESPEAFAPKLGLTPSLP